MRVALILVHYRTPALLPAAVAALRGAAPRDAVLETLVVDNGNDEAGRALFAELDVTVLDPGRNLGFAGGVNLGVATTAAERIVVLNPDVLVQQDCLRLLLAELDAGTGVAGPSFFWDQACRIQLPPTERVGRYEELLRTLAERGPSMQRRARRRWRRHARRHWLADRPLTSYSLSGGLLAIRRDAWERVGPFDDAYPLYFEETDWLARARSRGVAARFVPAARAVHLHGESARREPRAQAWFDEGARRFRRRHYGVWFERGLQLLAPPDESPSATAPAMGALDLSQLHGLPELWIEISPRAAGFPAAAERLSAPLPAAWTVPAEIRPRMLGGPWTLRAVDTAGGELLCARVRGED